MTTHLNTALHALQPPSRASELVSCTDVIHDEPVQDADDARRRDVPREERSMTRVGTAIATYEDYSQREQKIA